MRVMLLAACTMSVAFAEPASAAYLLDVQQVGANVVVTGRGSIDYDDLTYQSNTYIEAAVEGDIGLVAVGSGYGPAYAFIDINGPSDFGSAKSTTANSYTGTGVGLLGSGTGDALFFNSGYISGSEFGTSTATFDNQSISSLGLISGTYVYSFGSGVNADSITVQIGNAIPAAVPEPATWAMMLVGLGAAGFALRRRANVNVSYA